MTFDQQIFRKILMDTLFKDGVRDLGRALMIAKRDFAYDPDAKYTAYGAPRGVDYLVYEMNLFGDPALRLPAIATPVPQALVVTAVRTGNQVKLSWDTVSKDIFGANPTVTNYGIWRSTRPYFDPDAANCNCTKVAETTNLNWNDDGSVGPIIPIGDVNNNYFYVVRAQNSAGWSTSSNRTGEFDFALRPGQ